MLHLTWLDLNTWLVELDDCRILVDPWFVGPMTLGLPAWALRLDRPQPRPIPENLDLVLISQGLPDHAHAPSLTALDRHLPIIGPPSAANLVKNLGFTAMTVLQPGEIWQLEDRLKIQATVGAPIGPLRQENGYVLRAGRSGDSLYYEPHGFPDPNLSTLAPVDVVITPMVDVSLPVIGPIIAGASHGLELVNSLQPQVIVPTAELGNLQASGLLAPLLQPPPSSPTLIEKLKGLDQAPKLLKLTPGEPTAIPLEPQRFIPQVGQAR